MFVWRGHDFVAKISILLLLKIFIKLFDNIIGYLDGVAYLHGGRKGD